MVYWNRFISYIYRYHEGHKCENSGFARWRFGGAGKVTIGLRNGMNNREEIYGVYIYRETLQESGGIPEVQGDVPMIPLPVLIGKMKLRGGRGEECFSFDWNNVGESGKPITAFAGIVIRKLQDKSESGRGYYGSDIFVLHGLTVSWIIPECGMEIIRLLSVMFSKRRFARYLPPIL